MAQVGELREAMAGAANEAANREDAARWVGTKQMSGQQVPTLSAYQSTVLEWYLCLCPLPPTCPRPATPSLLAGGPVYNSYVPLPPPPPRTTRNNKPCFVAGGRLSGWRSASGRWRVRGRRCPRAPVTRRGRC